VLCGLELEWSELVKTCHPSHSQKGNKKASSPKGLPEGARPLILKCARVGG
jgi:hypothetical protein